MALKIPMNTKANTVVLQCLLVSLPGVGSQGERERNQSPTEGFFPLFKIMIDSYQQKGANSCKHLVSEVERSFNWTLMGFIRHLMKSDSFLSSVTVINLLDVAKLSKDAPCCSALSLVTTTFNYTWQTTFTNN